jgi:Protein of unknown function (DUF4235)
MRLLFFPFAIIGRMISARIGRSVFNTIWMRVDDGPLPNPTAGQASVAKVVAAHALEAGVMAGTAAAVDRYNARIFHYLIGIWPGKPAKAKTEDE